MAEIIQPSEFNIQKIAQKIAKGEIVGVPTETVYGLAAHAFNPDAILKVFKTKERPAFDPLIVHLPRDFRSVVEEVIDFSRLDKKCVDRFTALAEEFWPGPITFVLPKKQNVPDLATSGLETVGVRVPRHNVTLDLLSQTGPLVAPSANRFGKISPTCAADVLSELGDRISFVLEGGSCEIGIESTVLTFDDDGAIRILRPGPITKESLSSFGEVKIQVLEGDRRSPGLLKSHYAPSKPLLRLPTQAKRLNEEQIRSLAKKIPTSAQKIGLISNQKESAESLEKITGRPVILEELDFENAPEEAAKNLFRVLRKLDRSEVDFMMVDPIPNPTGIRFAIADRLSRAAAF